MYIMYFDHRPPPLSPSLSPPFGFPLIFKWFSLYFHLFLIHIWSVRENMQHLSFCICLISLSVWSSSVIFPKIAQFLYLWSNKTPLYVHICVHIYIHTYNMHIIYFMNTYIQILYHIFKYSHLLDASGLVPFFGYYIGAIVSVSVQHLCCVLT